MFRLIPVVISCFLVAAHFLRIGQVALVIMWCSAPLLLIPKRKWIPIAFTLLLTVGAAIWVSVAIKIWRVRALNNLPATRMAIILGAVALFTLLSSLVFKTKALKKRYRL